MNAQEWNARKGTGGSLQQFLRSRGRYLHISVASSSMSPVMSLGTYDIGRNKAKRAAAERRRGGWKF